MNMQDTIRNQLAELVALPSVSSLDTNFDMSNVAVVDRLSDWFTDAGFDIRIQEVCESPHKQNLIAHLGDGRGDAAGGGLVLSGHTDTVPYDTTRWDSDPFELCEKDGAWYGLGSADMKVFFPCVLAALESIDRRRLKRPLTVLATADEESTLAGVRRIVEQGTPLGRFAVIGEPTQLVPIFKHKGVVIGRIHLQGRSGHSSDPALGANALDAMHDVLGQLKQWREEAAGRFRDENFKVPVPTMNFGAINGGDSPNRICAECELLFDIRIMPGMDIDAALEELNALVTSVSREHGVTGICEMPILPMPPMETDADSLLVQHLVELSGNQPQTVAFGTEGPFLNQLGCETVIFGPGNIATAHQPNEYVEIERTTRMVEILEQVIVRFCCDE